jgi:predicted DNA-binding antitoxin AbrB/MazE fold protein
LVGPRDSIDPMKLVEARYEKGLLKPTRPLQLRPGERVNLIVVRRPDPNRWNLDRLRKLSSSEDLELAEQGLSDWSATLDKEDQ